MDDDSEQDNIIEEDYYTFLNVSKNVMLKNLFNNYHNNTIYFINNFNDYSNIYKI